MCKVVLNNGKRVGYYYREIPVLYKPEEDYIIVIISSDDRMQENNLMKKGYYFADRSISLEIAINKWEERVYLENNFYFKVSTEWNVEELYQLVKKEFNKDCRFAVDIKMSDLNLKNELLYNFIVSLRKKNIWATCCYMDNHLVGFNLWGIQEKKGHIFLGAVSNKYKGTGIAIYIYSCTIQNMKNEGIKILLDTIFTSNIQSINLHIMLAKKGEARLKIKKYEDWYKKMKE
nr:hypothetical protein [uncultured Schaedlerella sp.]